MKTAAFEKTIRLFYFNSRASSQPNFFNRSQWDVSSARKDAEWLASRIQFAGGMGGALQLFQSIAERGGNVEIIGGGV